VLVWQGLSASIMMATVLAGAVLFVPSGPGAAPFANLLHTCVLALQRQYATPFGDETAIAGLVLTGVVLLRLGYSSATVWRKLRRERRLLHQRLLLLAKRQPGQDELLVIPYHQPIAYCLPGRHPEVVLTSGALACLEDDELAAVVAHERAHLRARHDIALAAATTLQRAFPFVPAFKAAAPDIARLLEMNADDAAAAATDRWALTSALMHFAEGAGAPSGTLAMTGGCTLTRAQRLAAGPQGHLGKLRNVMVLGSIVALIAAPLILALVPALAAFAMEYCPIPTA
jgi:Zn-dependent protease with chaperone function